MTRQQSSPLPAAVHWYEGMLLAPQHFQLASLRSEALTYYHTAAVSPFHWGLLDLDRAPLAADGMIAVHRLEAVMPDGLAVVWPNAASEKDGGGDLRLNLKDHQKEIQQGKLTVFLTVTAHQPGERFRKRFDFSTKERVADDNDDSGHDEIDIPVLTPILRLVLTDELESSDSGFPLMRVTYENNVLVEDATFEPPWLRVRPLSNLHKLCDGVAKALRGTAAALARRIKGQEDPKYAIDRLASRLMLHAFVASLPPFEALLKTGATHPFTLYLALCSLLGSAQFQDEPPNLEAYHHDDLLRCFSEVKNALETIRRAAVKEHYDRRTFNRHDQEFALRIDASWIGRELVLAVEIPAKRTENEVDEWVMGSTIAPRSLIESRLERRVLGLQRKRLLEHELIPAAGIVFYSLDSSSGALVAGEELAIVNPGKGAEKRPQEIVLYVETRSDNKE